MRVSYEWLLEYIDPGVTAAELAEMFNLSGVEVGAVERFGPTLPNVVVGQVTALEQHPGRSNLVLVKADVGDDILHIVCGAKNMKVGDKVIVAKPGSILPGSRHIEEAVIYGESSSGMLCSAQELGLDLGAVDEILVIDKTSPVGEEAEKVLGFDDFILHLELTPNRADCLGMVGVANEVAALTGGSVKMPRLDHPETGEDISSLVKVSVEDEELCPRYTIGAIKNIKIERSPFWMQLRLLKAGIRPINNIVDITNYVMWEFGQPLHAFDLQLIKNSKIVVRRAKRDEILITLDGLQRKLDTHTLVIADGVEPVGLAGVMGGENTEITSSTRDVLIEAANFDPTNIRKTARRFNLPSEASQRFERGVNPQAAIWAQERTALLISEIAGGEVARGIIDHNQIVLEPRKVNLRPERVNKILGLEIAENEMVKILSRLGFEIDQNEKGLLKVSVPLRRADIVLEEDLVEEIARLYGYDNIPTTLPKGKLIENREPMNERLLGIIKNTIAASGYFECITYSFINPINLMQLRLPENDVRMKAIPVQNPFSEEQAVMRTTLLPGLLKVVQNNINHRELNQMLFEIGSVYETEKLPLESLPVEKKKLTLAVTGLLPEANWIDKPREADIFTIKGALDALFSRLGIEEIEYAALAQPFSHPSRSAVIKKGELEVGYLTQLHPEVADNWEISQSVSVCELDLQTLLNLADPVPEVAPLPRYPAAKRDLALVVSKDISASQLEEAIRKACEGLAVEINLFDLYEGKQIPSGKRSMAFSITFRHEERTLTDLEVSEALGRIQNSLSALGAVLRG